MSVIAIATAATAVVGIGTKAYAGAQAMGVDSQAGVDASKGVSMAETMQLGQAQDLKLRNIEAKSKNMMQQATSQGQKSMLQIFKEQEASARSGFAGSGAADESIDTAKAAIHSDYKSSVDRIMEEKELSTESVSLSTQKEKAAIQGRLDKNITAAVSQADTFWEGFAGQGDYKIG